MILGFKQHFPWGEPTFFVEKILAVFDPSLLTRRERKKKIHTIRSGNRWKPGMKIHMATGVRTKKYNQFNCGIPELSVVKSVQEILIDPKSKHVYVLNDEGSFVKCELLNPFVRNDGFTDEEQFWKFFTKLEEYQLIHWTDLKY